MLTAHGPIDHFICKIVLETILFRLACNLRQGPDVDAMRTILSAVSMKIRKSVILEIIVRKRAEDISN